MRVLFVTEDLANGGSERVISVLANGFAEEHESAVAAIRWDKVTYKLDSKVKYYPFKDDNKGKIQRTIGRFSFLIHTIREFKPDIVVAFDTIPISYSYVCCKLTKQKLVVSERADPERHKGRGIISILYFKAFEKSSGAVFQTEDAKHYFSPNTQQKSIVIPNPINDEFVTERYHGERAKEIVTACRLTAQKNIRLFIDIVSEVTKKYPDYKGIVYGEGPDLEKLQAYAKEQNAEEYIVFAGKVSNIKEKIYKSQFYLCTSDFEGISNSMLEAMALGLNVISTDCPMGGARMAITSGIDGMLFPVGDKERGTAAIIHLIEDPLKSEAIGEETVKICDRWSSRKITAEWIEYLSTLTMKAI